jgi:hypothetical protein
MGPGEFSTHKGLDFSGFEEDKVLPDILPSASGMS